MKRVGLLVLVVSLLLSLSACGAKSEPVYEGEYASQEAFLEAMAKGISNRLKNVDDDKQRTDEENCEYLVGLVNYELEQIEAYENLVFEDTLFDELAHGYISACKMQLVGAQNYKNSNLYNPLWNGGSTIRNGIICELYSRYNLPITSEEANNYSASGVTVTYSVSTDNVGNNSAIKEDTVAKLASEDDFVFVNNGNEIQINGYKGNGGNIIIPPEIDGTPVTRIADSAFKDATNITGVVLPEKLQYIGDFAFVNLDNLRGVIVLPESMVEVGGHAFQSTGITGVVIQSDCELNVNAFANAYEMEFVYVADGCAPAIGTAVFGSNKSLNVAVFPEDMYQIKDETFNACNALVIYAPAGSYAEKYAKNNFIQTDTDGYAEQVEYFAEIYG